MPIDAGTFWSAVGAIGTCVAAVAAVLALRRNTPGPSRPESPVATGPIRDTNRPPQATPPARASALELGRQASDPLPLPVHRVVPDHRLADDIKAILDSLSPAGPIRGITFDDVSDDKPRALIYWGPLPSGTDGRIRELAKRVNPDFNVSPVREGVNLGGVRTATLDNPMGY